MRSLWWEWLDITAPYFRETTWANMRVQPQTRHWEMLHLFCFELNIVWVYSTNFTLLHTFKNQSGHLYMYTKNWTIMKIGCRKIDAFKLWWWRKLLDCKEIKIVSIKGNQPWIFTGRIVAEAEAPILWLPDTKSWLIGKDSDAGKDWGQEETRATEDEMIEWHHWLNVHEFEKTLEDR